jgi:apolipoprotein N-acyltransferase
MPLIAIVGGTLAFASFGWITSVLRRVLGNRPTIVAFLWVVFELLLMKFGFSYGLFKEIQLNDPLAHRIGILFGFLAVSFAIVYLNTCIALVIDETVIPARTGVVFSGDDLDEWFAIPPLVRITDSFILLPETRAPPHSLQLVA